MTTKLHPDLTICGLDELGDHSARAVTHVLSILDPNWPEPAAFFSYDPHHRTEMHFTDAIEPGPEVELPQAHHVEAILAFGDTFQRDLAKQGEAHLLIHCHAGISRSTAAMTTLLMQSAPEQTEERIFERLVAIRPQAWPNSRMIGFADELLGRGGRLTAALRRHYGRRLLLRPELAEIMRGLNRAREVEMALLPNES
ncbi:MAG: dual specificity protein phosphatase family protein [Hyphomicrobiales bacterium]|nr:dual specificity protein phosphatase family protein [Hyphomicrobiales bacterium]MBV9053295.1 dual specificity protein phosphatase family protein [Hyphomicrobiales bacterium]MBV9590021.1 dual specificity protein phosphatase family protein [Hyphomicrobiales bacterium]MBV9977869.1 dual specificity protein phosphatase family protein [Hyphomicrobiales bacterium]